MTHFDHDQPINYWDDLSLAHIESLLQDGEQKGDFSKPVRLFGSLPFHKRFSSQCDDSEFHLLLSFVDRFIYACAHVNDSEDRAVALALIAQFSKEQKQLEDAEDKYKQAIAIFRRLESQNAIPYRPDGNTYRLYGRGLIRSQIALARLYCEVNRLEEAEMLYSELMFAYNRVPWLAYDKIPKNVYAMKDGNDGEALATLACELGRAYERKGSAHLAAKRYDDFRHFILHLIHPNPNPPNIIPACGSNGEIISLQLPSMFRYDPIIGERPATIELMKNYLSFDAKRFSLWHRKDIAIMKALVSASESLAE